MLIIGEKINGAIPRVARAISERDEKYITNLVKVQEEAGAAYLDVCAGTSSQEEYDALKWLIEVVQRTAQKPICIDSPDPHMLVKVFPLIEKPGIINSLSGEGDKCEVLLPLLESNSDWQVIILACDNAGIAASADDKTRIAFDLINKASEFGIAQNRIHVDPLVLALSAVGDAALNFCEAVRRIKEKYPEVSVTAALSNISYGMPVRKLVNKNFLVLAMAAGLDSIIGDPLDKDVIETIYATEALLDNDRFCRNYNKAFRSGLIGPVKTT